jgi:eukaryotic-like serine/threonine-protein kinase
MRLEPETRLKDRYTIVSYVGSGSLGANYLARDGEARDALCTIREIGQAMSAEERLSAKAALEREAQFLAPIDHPSLRTRVDVSEQDDCLFVVRDWVDGVELNEEVSRRGGTLDVRPSKSSST